ncbi:MAG: type II toxin-antitoxin system HicA family toxin [Abditibacteriaceae bacterium]
MNQWKATKARKVLAALLRIGWDIKRQTGSHRTLAREGWPNYVFAFHDSDEIGPVMLSRIAKRTGLTPEDL